MFRKYVSVIMRFIVKSLSDSRLMPCVTAGLPFATLAAAFVESLFMLCVSHSLCTCVLSTGVVTSR